MNVCRLPGVEWRGARWRLISLRSRRSPPLAGRVLCSAYSATSCSACVGLELMALMLYSFAGSRRRRLEEVATALAWRCVQAVFSRGGAFGGIAGCVASVAGWCLCDGCFVQDRQGCLRIPWLGKIRRPLSASSVPHGLLSALKVPCVWLSLLFFVFLCLLSPDLRKPLGAVGNQGFGRGRTTKHAKQRRRRRRRRQRRYSAQVLEALGAARIDRGGRPSQMAECVRLSRFDVPGRVRTVAGRKSDRMSVELDGEGVGGRVWGQGALGTSSTRSDATLPSVGATVPGGRSEGQAATTSETQSIGTTNAVVTESCWAGAGTPGERCRGRSSSLRGQEGRLHQLGVTGCPHELR